ncbi:MAG: metallophosphoesterase [Proteobacteria bacterium]|nr:metallophosphoesterase [Pseudomonadota bacterium]MBU1611592.1 metallophosphoesterase [Pseudomonadota bacterium]
MFGTILLSLAAMMTGYVFWRLGGVPWLGHFSWPLRLGLGLLSWLLIWLGREYGHGRADGWASSIELVGMNLLVVIFLVFLLLLCADLLTGFGWLLPKLAPGLRGAALLSGLMLSALAMVQGMRPPVVEDFEVTLPGLPQELDGLVVVGVSDLHIGSQLNATWLQARVEQLLALQPDLIVLLGDIFEGHGLQPEALLPVLRSLHAPCGVYAVPGNHEGYGNETETLQLLRDAGINVLFNQWETPVPGLVMAGVENLTFRPKSHLRAPVAKALTNRPEGGTILLSHSPLRTEEAAAMGVGLMLCGHTHAGQVWPFGYLVRLRYPLLEGRYEIDRMTAIVSRGAGTWGARMRLWKPGQILRITLRARQAAAKAP